MAAHVQHCDVCLALEFRTRATHVCIQCQKLLCNGCLDRHNSDRLFEGHTNMAIKDVAGVTLHCRSHPQENVQMYCLTCGLAVCVVCVLSVHDDHDKKSFEEYVLEQQELLTTKVEEAKIKHEAGLSVRALIENKIASCDTDRQQAIQQINSNHDMLQRILETKRQLLLAKLDKTTDKRRMQLTEIKENLDQRILNLMEHKDMARELIANDLKLIKASKSFMSNFEASFTLENEETEEASSPKKVRFIPSYDINLGIVNCSVPQTLQGYLDHMKDIPADSSSGSLGFYDDSTCSQISIEDIVADELHKADKVTSDMYLPSNRPCGLHSISEQEEMPTKLSVATGKVQLNVNPSMPYISQPKLIVTISYKDVTSKDVKTADMYQTVPIGVAFKNEHKLYVTQWGIDPRSQEDSVHVYRQVKVGMVLYSLCSGDTCAQTCFEECNPWDVEMHQGLCYITDCSKHSHTIQKYLDDGTKQGQWPNQTFYQPSGLAFCVDRIIIIDHHKQVRVCTETEPDHPEKVFKIGIKDRQTVTTGTVFKQFQFTELMFVASNSKGWMVVSDTGADAVHIFSEDGDHMFSITTFNDHDYFNRPMGIVTDLHNNIYVADYGKNRVIRFDSNGIFIEELLDNQTYGITRPCGLALYGNLLALSCHDQQNIPTVKIYELRSILKPVQQHKCPCRWLRLCQEQEKT